MPRTLLVIEDELDYRQLLEHSLRRAGYEVRWAVNGAEGLDALKRVRPDMVLLDLNLPDMDGYEVCRRIRSDEQLGRVPIIMVTIQAEMQDAVKGLKSGADDYIHKPFDPEEVLARISALFRLMGAE